MTKNQVKEFLENLETGDVSKRDIQRHEEHLKAKEQARLRKLERDRQKLAPLFVRPANTQSESQPPSTPPGSLPGEQLAETGHAGTAAVTAQPAGIELHDPNHRLAVPQSTGQAATPDQNGAKA